jgi:ribonuclease H2 subunit B
MQKGDDSGKFRQLDEIMFINGYPGYQHLLSIAENSMQVVCEVKGGCLPAPFYLFN